MNKCIVRFFVFLYLKGFSCAKTISTFLGSNSSTIQIAFVIMRIFFFNEKLEAKERESESEKARE